MSQVNEFVHVNLWNMNGGSVPQESVDFIQNAVERAIKEAEDKSGIRLLYSIVVNEPAEVA